MEYKMRNGFTFLAAVIVAILVISPAAFAGSVPTSEEAESTQGGGTSGFDPRDLSGFWHLSGGNGGEIGPDVPPLTAAGQAAERANISANETDNPTASNDPAFQCNPVGFPRIIFDAEPVEFTNTEGRLLQLFQWTRVLREVWMDGRDLPSGENLDNLGPAWFGHSVGEWEGDTLVVTTVGLEDRAWLTESDGRPKSFSARIEERYRRVDADTIEMQMTVNDPVMYTAPWVGNAKRFERMAPERYNYFGWKGLFGGITEAICAPVNEVEGFNEGFRDPGVYGTTNP
jgi:hypothetical protein